MDDDIRNELLKRFEKDKQMRTRVINEGVSLDESLDKENTEYLKDVVEKHGWPTISNVGWEASQAAWLLVQHADHDLEFQSQCLELMKSLSGDEVSLPNIAYLEDRVRVGRGEPQLYGTQFYQEGNHFAPRPIEDEDGLEERRKAMDLEPFTEYKQTLANAYGIQI